MSNRAQHGADEYLHLDLDERKPVFAVSDQVRPKPACSTTKTS